VRLLSLLGKGGGESRHLTGKILQIAVFNRNLTAFEEAERVAEPDCVHLQRMLHVCTARVRALAELSFNSLGSSLLAILAAIPTALLGLAMTDSQLAFICLIHTLSLQFGLLRA